MPVHYFNDIDQIFPVGSVCRIAVAVMGESDYIAHLRSEIRMKINPDNYRTRDESLTPIMYLTGQKIKNENLLDIQSKFFSKFRRLRNINGAV